VAARRAEGRGGKRDTLPAIKVVGVRGDGCNAVNRMIQIGIHGVEFIAGNTDARALMHCEADVKRPSSATSSPRALGWETTPKWGVTRPRSPWTS